MLNGEGWRRTTRNDEAWDEWHLDGDGGYTTATIVRDGRKQPIAIVAGGLRDDEEVDAIADLCVAAPTLLKQFNEAIAWAKQVAERPDVPKNIRKAAMAIYARGVKLAAPLSPDQRDGEKA